MADSASGLQRKFGTWTATFVVLASMVGTGILVSPGYMMLTLGHPLLILGLWIVGGLMALCGALCVAELAAAYPQSGGEYIYLREAYGPLPAFLSGWTSFLLGFSAPLAVSAFVAASYLLTPWANDGADAASGTTWLATALIIALTVPNLLGYRQSAWTQNLTTLIKLALFAGLVVAGLIWGGGNFDRLGAGRPLDRVSVGDGASQLFYVMFAYSGWNAASYLAGEVRDPGRGLPRALIGGTLIVTALYVGLSVVFTVAVPFDVVDGDNAETIPVLAVELMFGDGMGRVFSVAVGATFLATVNAFVITGPRVYHAMAHDRSFPAIAGRTNRDGVPAYGMVAQSATAVLLLHATSFQDLYRYAAIGLSLFALLFITAVFVLRRRQPSQPRPFRVPLYPWVPRVFIVITMFMAVYALIEWTVPSLISVGSILLGVPLYHLWCRWIR